MKKKNDEEDFTRVDKGVGCSSTGSTASTNGAKVLIGERHIEKKPLPPEILADALQDRVCPASGKLRAVKLLKGPSPVKKLATALLARVKFQDQDPDEQFYPARCDDRCHHWHEDADAEGDTCNCGRWYRFADRIEETPDE